MSRAVSTLVPVLLLLIPAVGAAVPPTPDLALSYVPIRVSANSDFETLGIPGSGTPEDPYVIEGREYALTTWAATPIVIRGTDAHLEIRANRFEQVGPNVPHSAHAVVLEDARNVRIANNVVRTGLAGISVSGGGDVLVESNDVTGWLSVWNSEAVVRSNEVHGILSATSFGNAVGVEGNEVVGSLWASADNGGVATIASNRVVGVLGVGRPTHWPDHVTGRTLAVGNQVTGESGRCVAAYAGAVLRENAFHDCARLDIAPYYRAAVEPSNTLDGLPMLQLRDVADATYDFETAPIGWLQVEGARNVTFHGLDLAHLRSLVELRGLDGVTFTDARFHEALLLGTDIVVRDVDAAQLSVHASRSVVVEDGVFGSKAFCHAALSVQTLSAGATALVRNVTAARCAYGMLVSSSSLPASFVVDGRSRFENNTVGILVPQSMGNATLRVKDSSIVGNSYAALRAGGGDVDARDVWWGRAEGPRDGDIYVGSLATVTWIPWLTSPP